MALCQFGDVLLESDFPLRVATPGFGVPSTTLLFPKIGELSSASWYHHFVDAGGEAWLSLGKLESDYALAYGDLAEFLVSSNGATIRAYPTSSTPTETIRHLFLADVMPRVLGQQGRVVLHASAVRCSKGAIAFVGDSGSGKSTLCAGLGRLGFPVISDDCLLLKEGDSAFFAVPIHTGMRLWPDTVSAVFGSADRFPFVAHYTEKRWVSGDEECLPVCKETVRLGDIFVLASPERVGRSVSITPLAGQEALMALVNAAFRLDLTDKKGLAGEFERLGQLSASVRLWRLSIPRDLTQLPRVREAILNHFESRDAARCTA